MSGQHERNLHPARTNNYLWLLSLSAASRILTGILVVLTTYIPTFDASHETILRVPTTLAQRWASSLVRWDAFHFLNIAKNGYVHEYEYAFLPGLPVTARGLAVFASWVSGKGAISVEGVAVAGALAAVMCDTTYDLYHLTLHYTSSHSVAALTTMLSLLPSSPATLRHAGYTEPLFAFFSYKGMLFAVRKNWILAALCFAAAAVFRSTGFFLSGYIVWGLIVEPLLQNQFSFLGAILAIPLSGLPFVPFIFHQYNGYKAFCTSTTPAIWCSNAVPLIYSYVQSVYWNVGFLRYWTLQQLPNFALAAPVLLLLLWSTVSHISSLISKKATSPLRDQQMTPHALYALAMTFILLFASHTQIALRVAATMPYTYWAATRLWLEHPALGKWWVGWSVVWGAISIVLWGLFLPPA